MPQDPDDPPTSISPPNFESIFAAALKGYKKRTKKDIAAHSLAAQVKSCDSPNAVLTVLQTQVQVFDPSPSASEKWTRLLDPTITVLYAFSGFVSSIAGPVFPPAAAIFTGIGVLLQAVKDVSATQETLVDLFDRMKYFFMRLEKYIAVRPTAAMTEIIVQIMIEVISILGIVTKEIKQGPFKKYVKGLFGIRRVEGAFQRLDKLTQEEARMAEVETLTIAHRIDENVIHMGANVIRMDENVVRMDETVIRVDENVIRVDEDVIRVGENVEVINEGVQSVHMIVTGIDDKLESAHADVQGVHREVSLINTGVTAAREEIKEELQVVLKCVSDLNRNESRKDLRQWIDPPDPSSNLRTASDNHHEGTAAWCTEGKTFANWMVSGSLLWIHGKPGSGKTILSSVIIRHIESIPNAGSAFLAYFYFDFKDEGKKDSRALLSSLLDQLSDQSDHLRDVLRGLYSEHRDGSKKPHDDALLRCLKDMLTVARSAPIYLVMDALDECPDDSGDRSSRSPRGKVLSVVKELVELRLPNLRLCITSRPEFDIRTFLKPLAQQEISLHDESGQNQDINAYVTSVVQLVKNWRAGDKEMVISELTKNADGMFRWVYCQLEVLRKCLPKNLRRILKELPKSLDETYQRILKEINNANQKEAHRLLQCLAVATRPLRVDELAEVLALDVTTRGIPTFNADWRWEDHEAAVLSACSSLVSVVNDDDFQVVQFAHFSVKEFLTSDRLTSMKDVSHFNIANEPSHVILAQACFGVLLSLDDHSSEDSVKDIPFYKYASTSWPEHTRVGNVEVQIKDALDCFFDMDKPHLPAWLGVDGPRGIEYSREEPLVPLYFAASYGFSSLVKRLIARRPQAIHICGQGGTPLHASVRGGHIELVKLLLAHGADINSRTADNSTPLHISIQKGHLEIARWLLNSSADATVNSHGASDLTTLDLAASQGHADICRIPLELKADVHVQDDRRNTPLHFAASGGHLGIARILLERNVEVNSRNDKGATPLLRALQNGHADVSLLLLNHNADVKVCGDEGIALLHLAADFGHLEVARILLERNAEIDSQDDHGCTSLLLASKNGHAHVVQLLLDHNANVQVRYSSGVTPLHLAAINGHVEVARMLLERNAEINPKDDHGRTPLFIASQNGHSHVVRLLLDHNADVHVRHNSGVTPLHKAAINGHIEVARMLLEHHAEVNSRDNSGATPLFSALENGHADVAQLLIDQNADAKVCGDEGVTLLHLAAMKGHLEFSRIFLERNAEINPQDDDERTPLLIASENGHAHVVRLLLDHNADVHICDNTGRTPLHQAAIEGHVEVVRMLLERNAEINAQDNHGCTPLSLASEDGFPDVVQLLLDHNADLDVRDGDGDTVLHCAAIGGRLEVARLLLKLNMEVNSRNNKGSTPLHLASGGTYYSEKGYPDVVRLLLDHGADSQARNLDGQTASEVARGPRQQEIVQVFADHAQAAK